jgi:hypothetical protein
VLTLCRIASTRQMLERLDATRRRSELQTGQSTGACWLFAAIEISVVVLCLGLVRSLCVARRKGKR